MIVLVLFFPTLLSSLFGITGNTLSINNAVLNWGVFVAFFILIFIFTEVFEDDLKGWVVRAANILLLIEAFVFAPILMIFAQHKTAPLDTHLVVFWALKILLWLLFIIPIIISDLLLFNGSYNNFRAKNKNSR